MTFMLLWVQKNEVVAIYAILFTLLWENICHFHPSSTRLYRWYTALRTFKVAHQKWEHIRWNEQICAPNAPCDFGPLDVKQMDMVWLQMTCWHIRETSLAFCSNQPALHPVVWLIVNKALRFHGNQPNGGNHSANWTAGWFWWNKMFCLQNMFTAHVKYIFLRLWDFATS